MKGFFRFSMFMMTAPLLCGAALIIGYVMLVVMTIPQLPDWAQPRVEQWLFDIPQHSESDDNGSSDDSDSADISIVPWDGYVGDPSNIHGLPLVGPVQLWSTWYENSNSKFETEQTQNQVIPVTMA